MASLQLDRVEAGRDLGGSVGVAGEEDVLGQLSGAEIDVVLPFTDGERDAVVRDRQAQLSSCVAPASRCEARARVDARSNGRQARSNGLPADPDRSRRLRRQDDALPTRPGPDPADDPDGVAGLDEIEERSSLAAQLDAADRGAVIEAESGGAPGDDETADPDQLAEVIAEGCEVDVGDAWVWRFGGPGT